MRSQATIRIRIITGIVLFLAFGLVARLYAIQVAHHDIYEAQASEQYVHSAQNIFNRGSIYFTTKDNEHVSAASIRSGYLLAANPRRVTDAEAAYEHLAPYLSISEELFLTRVTLADRTYVELESQIPQRVAEHIRELDLPGFSLYTNQWRHYPGDDLAAQTIGFTAQSQDGGTTRRGRYGLERYYDALLQQKDETLSVNFFAEIFTNLGSMVPEDEEVAHHDIITTLEPTVTRMLDETLRDLHEEYSSIHTGGIIMDPKTGDIYAMSVVPGYNNNNRSAVTLEQFQNPLVQSVVEFGSIVKPLTVAAGLDADVITPHSSYFDAGHITIDGARINNYDGRGRGTVDMQDVLNQSLNTGVSYIVDQMGTTRFREYFLGLELGEQTGIDLPNEASGLVNNLHEPRRVEYATASFGQGIAFTPIAMIRALATLGNGGELVTPRIVSHVQAADGTVVPRPRGTTTRVFTPETSETISRMLTNTVDEALRGGDVALPHHTVAAKTGTAQIPNQLTGGYLEDEFLHSFFGYFPAYEPRFIVLLYTVKPQGVRYASETLTDPFMDVTNFLINYYQIPPDRS